jgi:hypothetical protein
MGDGNQRIYYYVQSCNDSLQKVKNWVCSVPQYGNRIGRQFLIPSFLEYPKLPERKIPRQAGRSYARPDPVQGGIKVHA